MLSKEISIRTDIRPGDIGRIVEMHGETYWREFRFDQTFEAYVAGPLSAFVLKKDPLERIWIAESNGRLAGCIAIVAASPETAQLRWFLVDAAARGSGLGTRMIRDALEFCKQCGYTEVILWTVSALTAAARLYESAGFRKTEEKPVHIWGVDVVEEKYELKL